MFLQAINADDYLLIIFFVFYLLVGVGVMIVVLRGCSLGGENLYHSALAIGWALIVIFVYLVVLMALIRRLLLLLCRLVDSEDVVKLKGMSHVLLDVCARVETDGLFPNILFVICYQVVFIIGLSCTIGFVVHRLVNLFMERRTTSEALTV